MYEFGQWTEVQFDSLNYQSVMRMFIVVMSKCCADIWDHWFLRQACHTSFLFRLIPMINIGPNLLLSCMSKRMIIGIKDSRTVKCAY